MNDNPYFEADITAGLTELAYDELNKTKGVRHIEVTTPESIRFNYRHKRNWEALCQLRLSNGVYFVQPFPIPRPKSLLGHANWQKLRAHVGRVQEQMVSQKFGSITLAAAGQQSAVFLRLMEQLSQEIELPYLPNEGDLLLRIRKNRQSGHWEVMIRLTTRPLSTRPWRVADMKGALSGPLAAAMAQLSQPSAGETVLNVMCGSASLLIETALVQPNATFLGCDLNWDALQAAEQNLTAARVAAILQQADAQQLPYADNCADIVFADLPWGQLVGSHAENSRLHPAALAEMARILKPNGRCLLITHEIRLLTQILHDNPRWIISDTLSIHRGNIRPQIYLLRKAPLTTQ